MYEVSWSPDAREDLFAKVKTGDVARALVEVARTALDEHRPPDGGQVPPYLWRRGLTPHQRSRLAAAEPATLTATDTGEQPWDYVLVYKRHPHRLRRGYLILGIYQNSEYLDALARL